MRKLPIHRVNGAVHAALSCLKDAGSAKADLLFSLTREKVPSVRTDTFDLTTIPRMTSEGLIEVSEGVISITQEGLATLREIEARKPIILLTAESAVKAHLYTANRDNSPYLAEELKHVAWRPGAFDYLSCPSMLGGKQKPYHIKLAE